MNSDAAHDILASLTASQWGMVTTAQAQRFGVARYTLSRLASSGRFERLSHGVYRSTSAPSDQFEQLHAIWLSLHPELTAEERLTASSYDAVVCLESAAWLHNAGDFVPEPYRFATPQRKQTQQTDFRLRLKDYPNESVTICEGIPVTSFEQTVADLVENGMDLSLVSGMFLHCPADILQNMDYERLATLLAPFAARNGLAKNDGQALLYILTEPLTAKILKQLQDITRNTAPLLQTLNHNCIASNIITMTRNLQELFPQTNHQ